MSASGVQHAINTAVSNGISGPPGGHFVAGHIDTQEARDIVRAATSADGGCIPPEVEQAEVSLIADLYDRRIAKGAEHIRTCGHPIVRSKVTMDRDAVSVIEAFLVHYSDQPAPYLKSRVEGFIEQNGYGPAHSDTPSLTGLIPITIADNRLACGALVTAYVNAAGTGFFLSAEYAGRGGDQINWYGPNFLSGALPPQPNSQPRGLQIYKRVADQAFRDGTAIRLDGQPVANLADYAAYDITPEGMLDVTTTLYLIEDRLYVQRSSLVGPTGEPVSVWHDVGPAPVICY